MEDKKRRAFNFNSDELEALVAAVESRKGDLFGKFSYKLTSQTKEHSWNEVADSVSSVCGVLRTTEPVKKKWQAIASAAKTRGAMYRKDKAQTGGGVATVKPLTTFEEKVIAVMGPVYTEGISTGSELGFADLTADPSQEVILTLVPESAEDTPSAVFVPSPAKKKKPTHEPKGKTAQEELLELEREKLSLMRAQLEVKKQRLALDKEKFDFLKQYLTQNSQTSVHVLNEI